MINGLLTGGVYALLALGLTLIYGVLHIVNFAHGSLLMVAMFGAWLLADRFGLDPYLALPLMVAAMFGFGWLLYAGVIGRVVRRGRPHGPAGDAGRGRRAGQPGAGPVHGRHPHDRDGVFLQHGRPRAP